MKIVNVRACQPPCASPPDWRTSMGQILVAIDTEDGLTGYGVGGGGLAGVHVVRTVLRDLLLNQDPTRIEELWQAMYQATLPFGRKGLAIMAISGVDLALWDLYGKRESQPVANLLDRLPDPPRSLSDSSVRRPIPTYVTVWGEIANDQALSSRAFKLHVETQSIGGLIDLVQRTRARIGPDAMLMLDAWMRWDLPTTLKIAESLVPYDIAWIEEPLPIDDVRGYAELMKRSPIPIAGGEHEFTAAGFADVIERGMHHILQPDVCWCGGMSELVKIYRLAQDAGLRVCPHRGAEVWGLHAIAALDPQPLAESGRPWMTWVHGQPPILDGFIQLTDAPGFGVSIDETACGCALAGNYH